MTITRTLTGLVMPLVLLGGCGGGQDGNEQSEASTSARSSAAAAPENASDGAPASDPASAAAAVPDKPPMAFMQCRSCHAVEPGKNGIGPTLHGIVGKKAGSASDFKYSSALEASGIVWNRETLDEWLAGPMQMVPGTRMVVPVRDAQQRQEIIDYLETLK